MKIKIISTVAIKEKNLIELKKWFKIDFDFQVEFKKIKLRWFNLAEGQRRISRSSILEFVDKTCDVLILNVSQKEWESTDSDGYTKVSKVAGNRIIAQHADYGKKRSYSNWLMGDRFAGRTRHELCHVIGLILKIKDNVHLYEYEQKKLEKFLDEIDYAKLFALTSKPKIMGKIAQHPIDYNPKRFGYKFGQKVFQGRRIALHAGVDYNSGNMSNADRGMPVMPFFAGKIIYVRRAGAGWGNLVVCYNEQLGMWWRMAHFDKVYVKEGAQVDLNTVIGRLGSTGTNSPHCHGEMIIKKLPTWTSYTYGWTLKKLKQYFVDPLIYVELLNK